MANGLTRYNRPRAVGQVVAGTAPRRAAAPMSTTPVDAGAASEYYRSRIGAAQAGMDPTNLPRAGSSTTTFSDITTSRPGTGANELSEEELAYITSFNPFGGATTEEIDAIVAKYVGGGGGGSSGMTEAQRFEANRAMREEERRLAGGQRARGLLETALAQARQTEPTPGSALSNLLASLGEQERLRSGQIGQAFTTARQNLEAAGTRATEMATPAFNTLRQFLAANQPQAYATAPRAGMVALEPGLVEQYARAIGAPTQAIGQAAVEAAQQSAGAGEAYNRLLDFMRSQEQAAAGSRAAEAQMAETAFTSQLANLLAGGRAQLGAREAEALAALAKEIEI